MGLLLGLIEGRRRRAARKALRAAIDGGRPWHDALNGLSAEGRCEVLEYVLRLLLLDDRESDAESVLDALRPLDPARADDVALDLAIRRGDRERAIDLCHRQLADHPDAIGPRGTLAGLLVDTAPAEALALLDGRFAREPELALVRVDALIALGRLTEARDIAAEVRAAACRGLDHATTAAEFDGWRELMMEASRRFDDLAAELEGAESLIGHAAGGRLLDGRAGINYTLMAHASMLESPSVAVDDVLRAPDAERAFAEAARPEGLRALALRARLALADLRDGRTGVAEAAFRALLDEQPGFFPALLGLGAALDERRHGLRSAAAGLTREACPAHWLPVVPDLRGLTSCELRVVHASVAPLAAAVPAMAAAGARVRILPIDMRSTDLVALSGLEGEVADDHRTLDAVAGLATPKVAVSRLTNLIDTCTDAGWTFAHEFAHMAFWHLPGAITDAVEGLYRTALEHPHVMGDYQLQNVDEFFAVGYEHFLAHRYERPTAPVMDDVGVRAALFALYERIEGMGQIPDG